MQFNKLVFFLFTCLSLAVASDTPSLDLGGCSSPHPGHCGCKPTKPDHSESKPTEPDHSNDISVDRNGDPLNSSGISRDRNGHPVKSNNKPKDSDGHPVKSNNKPKDNNGKPCKPDHCDDKTKKPDCDDCKCPSPENKGCKPPPEYYKLGCPFRTTKPCATTKEQLDVLLDFTHKLYELKQVHQVFDRYVARNYLNHAPEVSGPGRQIAANLLAQSLPGGNVTIARRVMGNNEFGEAFGTTHFKGYNPHRGYGDIMYVQRFIGTCIVEAWDVAMPINYESTKNPIAYF